jgi:hypothetical protein
MFGEVATTLAVSVPDVTSVVLGVPAIIFGGFLVFAQFLPDTTKVGKERTRGDWLAAVIGVAAIVVGALLVVSVTRFGGPFAGLQTVVVAIWEIGVFWHENWLGLLFVVAPLFLFPAAIIGRRLELALGGLVTLVIGAVLVGLNALVMLLFPETRDELRGVLAPYRDLWHLIT